MRVTQPAISTADAGNGSGSPHSCALQDQFRLTLPPFSPSWTDYGRASHSGEVVGRHGQGEYCIDPIEAATHHLADSTDGIAPAEALLDALALDLADAIAGVAGGAGVDSAAAGSLDVLCHMRRDVLFAARLHEAVGVVALVGADRDADLGTAHIAQHQRCGIALGGAVGLRCTSVDHEAMAVVGQNVTQVAQQCRGDMALAIELRLRIRGGGVDVIAALLSVPVLGRAAVIRAVLVDAGQEPRLFAAAFRERVDINDQSCRSTMGRFGEGQGRAKHGAAYP